DHLLIEYEKKNKVNIMNVNFNAAPVSQVCRNRAFRPANRSWNSTTLRSAAGCCTANGQRNRRRGSRIDLLRHK
ncbi:hypothetical protein PFISCL1PPCAC_3561, partial [Pristionchus fissidentatus]